MVRGKGERYPWGRGAMIRALACAGAGACVLASACGGTTLGELLGYADAAPPDVGDASIDGSSADVSVGETGPAPHDAAPDVRDAAPDVPSPPTIACPPIGDDLECQLATEVCCRGPMGFQCRPKNAACPGLVIPCAEAADCEGRLPGTVCCVDTNPDSTARALACLPPEECTVTRGIVCNPADDVPCPPGRTCQPSQGTLIGFYLCL